MNPATHHPDEADVCLILEGAYPYVAGGVSGWTHDLVKAQSHLRFHLVALTDGLAPKPLRYELPSNIVSLTRIAVQCNESRLPEEASAAQLVEAVEAPLRGLLAHGELGDLKEIITVFREHPVPAELAALLNSEAAFAMLTRMYEDGMPGSSFLNYFWSWRSLLGGLFSTLLSELPRARLYHAISTGYAGLYMARAVVETGRPGLLTEHGIYTNERRIEIAMADWLVDHRSSSLDTENRRRDLRNLWTEAFVAYSRICYGACEAITTLFEGNQELQRRDGAPANRLSIIPNGIDYAGFSAVVRDPASRPPTVALVGRIVPIKDVKTFIRAAAILRRTVPDVRVLLMGPTDEDPSYYGECRRMVTNLGIEANVVFTGPVQLKSWFGQVDVVVLTSISEAQPLVLLEGGAAGIPCVATDVGSCREIVMGRAEEAPAFGPGGFIVPLADARACAEAVATLLTDEELRRRCGRSLQARVEALYNKTTVDRIYRDLYARFVDDDRGPDRVAA